MRSIKYLLHLPRESDYRHGRTQGEFVTSLINVAHSKDIEEFRQRLEDSLLPAAVAFNDTACDYLKTMREKESSRIT